jgi:hypothetical protein
VRGDRRPGTRRAGQRALPGRFGHVPDRGRSRRLGRVPGTGQAATPKGRSHGPDLAHALFNPFIFRFYLNIFQKLFQTSKIYRNL